MLEAAATNIPGTAYVQPLPWQAIVSIAAFKNTVPQLAAALGVNLPASPRRVTAAGVTYLWAGPETWVALAGDAGQADRITGAARPYAAVTEQGDGRCVFRVAGPQMLAALAKLVPIDLHPSAFPVDATALTLAGHISVLIWRDDAGGFCLACFRSFAEALYHSLTEASREYEG